MEARIIEIDFTITNEHIKDGTFDPSIIPEGTTYIIISADLLARWPETLTEIKENLVFENCKNITLPEDFKLKGDLYLDNSKNITFPDGFKLKKYLIICGGSENITFLGSLELEEYLCIEGSNNITFIKALKVGKSLTLVNSENIVFPDLLGVGECFKIARSENIAFPEVLKVDGVFGIYDSDIKELASNMTIGDDIYLKSCDQLFVTEDESGEITYAANAGLARYIQQFLQEEAEIKNGERSQHTKEITWPDHLHANDYENLHQALNYYGMYHVRIMDGSDLQQQTSSSNSRSSPANDKNIGKEKEKKRDDKGKEKEVSSSWIERTSSENLQASKSSPSSSSSSSSASSSSPQPSSFEKAMNFWRNKEKETIEKTSDTTSKDTPSGQYR